MKYYLLTVVLLQFTGLFHRDPVTRAIGVSLSLWGGFLLYTHWATL